MQKTASGGFIVTDDEMRVLRAGLFITIYHLDPVFEEDLQTVSGFTADQFDSMLRVVDDAS